MAVEGAYLIESLWSRTPARDGVATRSSGLWIPACPWSIACASNWWRRVCCGVEPQAASAAGGAPKFSMARSGWCDTRRRKGETTGNTNFDLNRRASPRPYLGRARPVRAVEDARGLAATSRSRWLRRHLTSRLAARAARSRPWSAGSRADRRPACARAACASLPSRPVRG